MNIRRWLSLLLTAFALALGACGGGSSSDSNSLKGTSYSGTLSGGKSGTFNFTVNDESGNGTGSATIAGRDYSIGGVVYSSGAFDISILGSNGGRIYGAAGSATKSSMSGGYYGNFPISASSSTTQQYEGSVSGSANSSSSGGGSTSTSGSSGASCGIESYKGPQDDPQTWTICASAFSYKCNGDTANAAKTCTYLTGVLKAYSSSQTAASYCSAYCN